MMELKQLIKQRVGGKKYPTLKRIKVGKALSLIAALPLFTSWLFIFSVPLMMPLSPSIWARSKLIDFKQWRMLR